ncbi:MAG TPA: acetate--CoA ligase family protein [Steroidobacteraceae bacterium]|nr:acetate--CoA ligase family protein [Steroidobacteraceae bacterium]
MKTPVPATPSLASLQRLFYPRSIALVGASERSPWSHMLNANLVRLGYQGTVYAVNKSGSHAHGYPGYRSCTSIGEAVDVAYLFVPVDAILDAFADVLQAGIKSIVILTSGFAEAGAAGAELQRRVVALARDAGAIILGPNCLGYSNLTIRAPLTPAPNFLPVLPPRVALVSQSGATNAQIADLAHDLNVGISLYIATGNEAMLDIAACVNFLVEDASTRVIMVFAESIRDTATFAAAARRALEKSKAIVVLKVGTTELTAKVAAAHTGSLVGDDRVFDAACRQLGVIRVHTLEDLLTTAALLAYTGPLTRPGIGVVSISGGACTLIADRAQAHGVDLPDFDAATKERLRKIVPGIEDPVNPFDITGLAMRDPAVFERALQAVADDPTIGFVFAVYEMPWNEKWHKVPQLEAIGRALSRLGNRGALLNQMLRPITEKSRTVLAETGIPAAFGGIEAVTRALGAIRTWSGQIDQAQPAPRAIRLASVKPVGERQLLEYLAEAGVPIIPATAARTRDEAVGAATAIGFPVVLKISSPDIAHKTEVGGVRLDLADGASVSRAFDVMMAQVRAARPDATVEGVLVSPMRPGGIELLVGVSRDPQWGPILMLGLGGIWVEVLADARSLLLPASAAQVKEALLQLRGAKLLQGYRGTPAVDMDALARVIDSIGSAALALGPRLLTLEVNPLRAAGASIEALDALAVWS